MALTLQYREPGNPVDESTEGLHLPLPHWLNDTHDDVVRLRAALAQIDAAHGRLADAKADKTALQALSASTSAAIEAGRQASADQQAALAAQLDQQSQQLGASVAQLDQRSQQQGASVVLLQAETARASASAVTFGSGRVASIRHTVAGVDRTTTLTYDSAGRVATATCPVPGGKIRRVTYSYGAGGALAGMTATEAAA